MLKLKSGIMCVIRRVYLLPTQLFKTYSCWFLLFYYNSWDKYLLNFPKKIVYNLRNIYDILYAWSILI